MAQTLATLAVTPGAMAQATVKVQPAAHRSTPFTPWEGTLKSELLFAQDTTGLETIAFQTTELSEESARLPKTVISDTPHPPPRASAEAIV